MGAVGYVSTTGDDRKVDIAGDTMTGELVLPDSSPDSALTAASKGYVDTQAALRLALTGGTMTGAITLPGNPSTALQATPKQYVDATITAAVELGATVTGLRAGNTALASLLTALDSAGIILDLTSNYTNVLTNGDFSAGTTEWSGGNATIAASAVAVHGAASLRLTASSTGDIEASNGSATGIAAGDNIEFSCWFQTTATRNCRIGVNWTDSGFGFISNVNSTPVSVPANTPTKLTFSATAPALAAHAVIYPKVLSVLLGEIAYVADAQVCEVP